MGRRSVSLFGVIVTVVVALGVPAGEAAAAPVPPRDVVVGSGAVGVFHDISIDASSDQLGGDANGSVSFVADVVVGNIVAQVRFAGPVTCLAVDGSRTVIGFLAFIGPLKVVVVDNGSTGSPPDEFGVTGLPTDCSDETGVGLAPLTVGGVVVRDAPSKAQCQDGGWRSYTDAAGQPFKSPGACIVFALGAA